MSDRETGLVKWFNNRRGYGFIDREGEDVFVHYRSIEGGGYKTLKQGERVEYTLTTGEKGLLAENVTRVSAEDAAEETNAVEQEPAVEQATE